MINTIFKYLSHARRRTAFGYARRRTATAYARRRTASERTVVVEYATYDGYGAYVWARSKLTLDTTFISPRLINAKFKYLSVI
jgi:hypothetical protein